MGIFPFRTTTSNPITRTIRYLLHCLSYCFHNSISMCYYYWILFTRIFLSSDNTKLAFNVYVYVLA